eukprot:NODE_313_length_10011_cov_0.634584.p8 type:complete len:199 gc:universal NODE_313_length_10011_cov_0.634584:8272-8868(+)
MVELSRKEYWDSVYKRDINILKDSGDIGEIWFGEQVEENILDAVEKYCTKDMKIVDIGCGNGSITNLLSQEGYDCTGYDYSEYAVELCNTAFPDLKFECVDILELRAKSLFNCAVDKGTLDAIYLSGKPTDLSIYAENMFNALKDNGFLFITSCNMTVDELQNIFVNFEMIHNIPYPVFQFGGQSGQKVTSLVFKKIN